MQSFYSVKVIEEVDPFLAAKKKASEISPALKGTSIFLVGISSIIKTRLGKLLADAFRYYFFDSDSLIEEAARSESSAKSFRERDEKGFRESETEVLKQLSAMGRLVVSVGDGAVQTSTNLSLLRHGISVWIDVPLDLVAREISEDGIQLPASQKSTSGSYSELSTMLAELFIKVVSQFLMNDNQVYTRVTQLYAEMKGGYAVADATVSLQKVASLLGYDECDAVPMEDLCLEVLKEIEKLMRVKKLMEEAARPF
ncbi:hypothetical protein LguiA_016916 [Lonicera macranthoides]